MLAPCARHETKQASERESQTTNKKQRGMSEEYLLKVFFCICTRIQRARSMQIDGAICVVKINQEVVDKSIVVQAAAHVISKAPAEIR